MDSVSLAAMMRPVSDIYHIYTDGSCLPNKRGAWAFVILKNDIKITQDCSGVRKTSSNRMEFLAAVMALKSVPVNSEVILWTDSKILIEAAQVKIQQWKNNDWQRLSGQPVVDLDVVVELEELMRSRQIEWRWVRGHSGNFYNEMCDELCRQVR